MIVPAQQIWGGTIIALLSWRVLLGMLEADSDHNY
jgi:hypothetical protein